ncbi:DUF6418 domain-containing protein [Novosphingobium sp. FKTRR1]|uniref:DUF6418 domain-containing protein n=1 Tax=Novosphingobium sp. FKTRR1 TaxID=2879118 RepID=UPI001CF0061C|nr:DUF6418 domain-containing protein [Novosphingobium sp. FKTRR1]
MIIAYYIAVIIFAFFEDYTPSVYWPFLALGSYLWFLRLLFQRYPRETMLMSIMAMTKILILFSLIMIGLGFWITELEIVGQLPVYSLYFCILSSVFIHAACQSSAFINRRIDSQPVPELATGMGFAQTIGAVALVGFGIAVLLQTGLTKGFATLDGIDRFEFRADADWFFNYVVLRKYMMTAALATVRFRISMSTATHRVIDAIFVAFLGLLMLFGDKFLSVIVVGIFYVLPLLVTTRGGARVRLPRSLLLAVVTLLPLVLSATVWVYSDYGAQGWDSTLDRLFGRSTGQGQIWYIVAHDHRPLLSVDGGAVQKLMGSMGYQGESDPLRSNVGIFYIISRYAPTNVYKSILANNGLVQFTGGFEAYLILLFGHIPTLFLTILFGIIAGMCGSYLYYTIRSRSAFGAFFASFIYMSVYTTINQGAIWMSVSLGALIYTAIYIIAEQIVRYLILKPGRRMVTAQAIAQ